MVELSILSMHLFQPFFQTMEVARIARIGNNHATEDLIWTGRLLHLSTVLPIRSTTLRREHRPLNTRSMANAVESTGAVCGRQ